MSFNKLPGYVGYSMSVNAKYAYDTGEKPYSKWTKRNIISFISNNFGNEWKEKYEKFSLDTLKSVLLCQSRWHHTSKYFNETTFYYIPEYMNEEDLDEGIIRCKRLEKSRKEQPKEEMKEERVKAIYLQWSGTRNHPKAIKHEAIGTIKGNWFYPDHESFKKSIKATGFIILEHLDKEVIEK